MENTLLDAHPQAVNSRNQPYRLYPSLASMPLIQPLPSGPLDVIGDIHGEYEALCHLLQHLGYDDQGRHPHQRTLVFVGDFVDRGPDSPAVVALVRQLVDSGHAVAVLGNHELNLLRGSAKEGSGWYFAEREAADRDKFEPYARIAPAHRVGLADFLDRLPLALERPDLRVVHAAWWPAAIERLRQGSDTRVLAAWDRLEKQARTERAASDLDARLARERERWPHSFEQPAPQPPLLPAHAELDTLKQMANPLRVLTSGVERPTASPFWAGGKWRMVERHRWWDDYLDTVPVVIGHYWRRRHAMDRTATGKHDPDVFAGIDPLHWHGARRQVFCVDFSVGGRWRARLQGQDGRHHYRLAALRWPERELVFDDGSVEPTR